MISLSVSKKRLTIHASTGQVEEPVVKLFMFLYMKFK